MIGETLILNRSREAAVNNSGPAHRIRTQNLQTIISDAVPLRPDAVRLRPGDFVAPNLDTISNQRRVKRPVKSIAVMETLTSASKDLQDCERRVAARNYEMTQEIFDPVEESIEKELYARKVN